ncbi:hypothetical protein BAUCODRAFT_253807 [Baudoinia panamericana UAMH 10762]|uniref:Transmembrane protein 135 N-terminal domain-containing protein n=1 Tax=Baudoinia panamericana (strain UAMH 10762) TaxID=717646 RepID=M2M886_BAUPA|nr:uncharacterized protein BAUCODRAFT_253807 [Baudoinia panamericana UAMH 10762]EMC92566.1 hypothetical protein BAUCODRAFT_253807 [Baudoinia panamericana UAMH 10762]
MSHPNRKHSVASSNSSAAKRPIDPITRTALRYSLSSREYELLHQYIISRAPTPVQKRTPDPKRYEKITESSTENGDYNIAALRAALRVFVAAYVGLKGWETLTEKLASRAQRPPKAATSKPRYANARIALSFSTILLFHRLLNRFFRHLRSALLEENAASFRKRNPRVTKLLTSVYTPSVGASLAGLLLGISPADQLRMTIAIYVFTRSLESSYNALDEGGFIWSKDETGKPRKPWWFGSWLLMPFACGQLLHAFVFDRECFPESYGRFILARSPEYVQLRPKGHVAEGKPWPTTFDIVDALAELSNLRWPPFVSPILFPQAKSPLPSGMALSKVRPITAPAHPGTLHTSCALLHPQDPSCGRVYLKYWIAAFPTMTKYFTLIYGAFALLAYKKLLNSPIPFVNRLAARILRISLFITGAIGTSWASICLFSNIFPRTLLPTQRWFLGGFLGGLWAFIARRDEGSTFTYSARLSIDSLYKVGKKRGWWRGVKNGDVLLFAAGLALLNVVYEKRPGAIDSAVGRKGISALRGEGWVDVLEKKGKDQASERFTQDGDVDAAKDA